MAGFANGKREKYLKKWDNGDDEGDVVVGTEGERCQEEKLAGGRDIIADNFDRRSVGVRP